MKVLYLTKYSRNGASSRLRSYQYFPFLEAKGISVSVSPFFDEDYLINLYSGKRIAKRKLLKFYLTRFIILFSIYKFDKIIIEKELFPYFFSWFEKALHLLKVKYIVDYDDAIFHNYDLSTNKLIAFCLKNKINKVMKYSGCVVVGNSYLAERAKVSGAKKIVLLPTVINTDLYTAKKKYASSKVIIGWIGSPSTFKYIKNRTVLFSKILDTDNVELHIVGSTQDLGLGDKVKYLKWTEDTEVASISNFDIGIMPLENTPWELGKCAYKLIQYMGCGVPVVASAVGMNIDVIDEGVNGFLVHEEAQWLVRINQLIEDSTLRETLGKKGRIKAELEFSIQKKHAVVLSVLANE
ncbi:glycosyltransferase family 4 protein [Flavobacterium franklandianum]|uniref:Glycosyltransferase family 4 protein n=1 Tax=Flavobacterium franklandianum TaxID=2594430 RepID=A0A553CK66_9FLAO|nr:glycosyltransferase family 4 protein [Flavobacterium franklandianum]TRX20890.1 glycosyltransferase family 4 protein [Flavobacterium franklandianum]